MTARWASFARGWAVAAFATFVAAFSHVVAGGGHPPMFAIALALAFSGIACVFLAGKRLSPGRLTASVVISQALYHGLFGLFGTGSLAASSVGGHLHSAQVLTPVSASADTVFKPAGPWMLLAHAAAAILTIVVVLHGERLCLGIATLTGLGLAALAGRLPGSTTPTAPRILSPVGHRRVVPHRAAILVSVLRYRGPPAGIRFA